MKIWRLSLLFILLLLIQVLLLNHIGFGGYINPQLYILFILILPGSIPGYALLLIAFFNGLAIDMFTGSLAIHTAATLFVAFCRPVALKLITSGTKSDAGLEPSFSSMGGLSLSTYAGILIVLHHSMLFFLEIFSFTEAGQTFSRILLSSLLTFIFVMIGFAFLERRTNAKRR